MIYTCITGNRDKPRKDVKMYWGFDKFKSPVLNAKFFKVLPHLVFNDEYSIWVDGNVFLKHPEEYYYQFLKDHDIAVLKHPIRTSIYEEAAVCLKWKKDNKIDIINQMNFYKNNYPNVSTPLVQLCAIVRRHTKQLNSKCEEWWAHINRFSFRDQISFPVVFNESPLVNIVNNNNHDNNDWFTRKMHIN